MAKEDTLNKYFTEVVNHLLQQLGFEEIQPSELKRLSILSTYQGTNRPNTVMALETKNSILKLEFDTNKLKSNGWVHFPEE